MKHRKLDGCLNPHKHHLWRLPSIPKDRWIDSPRHVNKMCLAVFPLFIASSADDVSLEHHLVRAACWGRRSWLKFSDALGFGTQIGFYVEESAIERVEPLLEECGVDVDRDVFLFDGSPFEGVPRTHLGKKLSVFCDDQFSEYEWVVQLDCDMWLGSPSGKHYPFFSYIASHAPSDGIGALTATSDECVAPPYPNIEDQHYWWKLLGDDASDTEKVKEWESRARSVAGSVVDAFIFDHIPLLEVHGGIYAFSPRYLAERPKEQLWIKTAGRVLQDDEAVFVLWGLMERPLFSIVEETGLPLAVHARDIISAREKADRVYFSHLGDLDEEWYWRADADAL